MTVKMVVRNKDKLFAQLRALDPQLQPELQKDSLKSAQEVATLAKALAPKNPATQSDYAATIEARPLDKLDQAEVSNAVGGGIVRGLSSGQSSGSAAAAGVFALWVWHIIENGSVNNPPYPHMRPAYRTLMKKIRGRLSRSVNKAVKRIGGK